MRTYVYSQRISWGDCDSAGIVYHPNFYRWFDVGSQELVREAGYAVRDLRAHGHDILLVETGCRYKAAGLFDDLVQVCSQISEVREKTFRVEHRCTRDGALLCEGFSVRVYANISVPGAFKAEAMPEAMRAALSA